MATPPEQRILELRDAIRHHEERSTSTTIRTSPTREFDRLLHELERLEAEHPDLVTLDFADDASRRPSRRGIRDGRAPSRRCSAWTTAYTQDELRAFDDRVRKAPAWGESSGRAARIPRRLPTCRRPPRPLQSPYVAELKNRRPQHRGSPIWTAA